MRKIVLILFCVLFSSCFKITEKLNHKSNQTGDYSLVIDFSDSWIKTRAAIMLGEVDGDKIPSENEMKQKLAQFRADASKIKGASKIYTSYDFNNYVFKLNFSYNSIETLNAVLNSINKENKVDHFKESNGRFERIASYPIPKKLKEKEDLEKATITAIYTFDKVIKTVQNPNSKLSKSKKTVFLRYDVWRVLNDNNLMNNSISFTL
ncbi:hypothetical protein HNQ02_000890 [Flavobacterium sp. 7E]|uniref:hypothetical protein n=1 Tax=unclassified Flavobacterium TaxID=196869 RepID=UPI0015712CD2|nr:MULTISPECIES: hypothetical protein [unclassified Flavobacterium]MBE0392111.1 hypothetical protein [Flavobacterium sp. PL002]NRS87980.1 hypothetical protein [Flavobacterium sp. 7E]